MDASAGNLVPDNCLEQIFSYLSLRDLRNCSLVCKRWYEFLNDENNDVWRLHCIRKLAEEALKSDLLSSVPTYKAKLRAFYHAWNPNDCSRNIYIKPNGFTLHRNPVAQSTDACRGKIGFRHGRHAWEVIWEGPLGTVAVIGIATKDAPLQCHGYVALLGSDDQSWGWNLVDNHLLHNGDAQGNYPLLNNAPKYQVGERIRVILDCDDNTLSFEKNYEFLGVAFRVQNGPPKEPPSTTTKEDKSESEHIDIIEKSIGVLGKWHIWICLAIFLVKFPVAWHQLSIVFVAARTDFVCAETNLDKCAKNCSTHIFNRTLFSETILSEWDLVCAKEYLADLAQTVTMLGILFGNMVFGYLSDKFGRKIPLVGAVVLQAVAGTIAAFSPWFILFLFMRFLAALATGGTMVTSFVLIMELIATEWRTVIGILYQIPFNIGHLLLPVISYFLRDWRYFQAAISLPSLVLIFYYWALPESPRWLLAGDKKEEAMKVLEKAARYNNLSTKTIRTDVTEYLAHKENDPLMENRKGNIMDLVRTPIMRIYTIAICFNWLVCGLCFFGVSQFIGHLGGNIFLNVGLSAIIQVPSTLFACYSTKAWGRRKTLIIANVLSGISLILIGFVPEEPSWIKSTLSTIGMFGLALSFPTVYIYSGELFPTMVRNIGVGTSSMCARIGSMVAPFVASLVTIEPWIPPIIFGVTPLIGAMLCLKLPETLDCKLPDTIEEAEMFEIRAREMKMKKTENLANNGTEMM